MSIASLAQTNQTVSCFSTRDAFKNCYPMVADFAQSVGSTICKVAQIYNIYLLHSDSWTQERTVLGYFGNLAVEVLLSQSAQNLFCNGYSILSLDFWREEAVSLFQLGLSAATLGARNLKMHPGTDPSLENLLGREYAEAFQKGNIDFGFFNYIATGYRFAFLDSWRRATDKNYYSDQTPLYEAIETDQTELLSEMLDLGFSMDRTTESGDTLLHIAAKVGAMQSLLLLIDKGASCKKLNYHGETFICSAIKNKQEALALHLLDLDLSIDWTRVFKTAVERNSTKIVTKLLEKKTVELAVLRDYNFITAFAIKNQAQDVLQLIVEKFESILVGDNPLYSEKETKRDEL